MRTIFENDDEEDFFEIILKEKEIEKLRHHQGVSMELPFGFRKLNVFIRTEIEEENNE